MKRAIAASVFILLGTVLAALWSGCELNSTERSIKVEPGNATLSKGQSQTFTVSGGYEYSWSLDPDDGSASLSARQGGSIVFTLLSSASSSSNSSATIAVTCTSTIPGVTGGSTNASGGDAYTEIDTAYVHVRPSG